jgi:PAT family beta-lactamase induction signal transducer AmpG
MAHSVSSIQRLAAVLFLGFASGLPLALTGQAMQAWLTVEGLDLAAIGFLSMIGLPYTFKFLWAPLMDRFECVAALGRRRGWLVLTQALLAALLLALAGDLAEARCAPFALLALAVAFASASQDVVIDAYRTDLLGRRARPRRLARRDGLSAGDDPLGRRGAHLDRCAAGRWLELARRLSVHGRRDDGGGGGLVVAPAELPRLPQAKVDGPAAATDRGSARHDLLGFFAVLAAVAFGVA